MECRPDTTTGADTDSAGKGGISMAGWCVPTSCAAADASEPGGPTNALRRPCSPVPVKTTWGRSAAADMGAIVTGTESGPRTVPPGSLRPTHSSPYDPTPPLMALAPAAGAGGSPGTFAREDIGAMRDDEEGPRACSRARHGDVCGLARSVTGRMLWFAEAGGAGGAGEAVRSSRTGFRRGGEEDGSITAGPAGLS